MSGMEIVSSWNKESDKSNQKLSSDVSYINCSGDL